MGGGDIYLPAEVDMAINVLGLAGLVVLVVVAIIQWWRER
jgi:hypothetical protein